jgi:signal peptidase II
MTLFKGNFPTLVTQLSSKKNGTRRRYWFFLVHIIAWATALDQGTKWWVRTHTQPNQVHTITPFLDWTHVWNYGISFSLFPCQSLWSRLILGALTLLFIGFLLFLYAQATTTRQRWGTALMIGGATTNGIDRIIHSGVFDFIHLHWGFWDFPVFNLADMLISMGFLALLSEHFQWNALRFQKKRR